MLTPSGEVKVMDFGIARAIADGTSTMTQTAAVVGTAQYLSPEQARGETVDSRSDVYSTGCLLYELLAGRPPVRRRQPVLGGLPARPRAARAAVGAQPATLPAELDAIVMKALAKRVEDRYQSAAEMRADIQRYLEGQPGRRAHRAPRCRRRSVRTTRADVAVPAGGADDEEEPEQSAAGAGRCVLVGVLLRAPARRRRSRSGIAAVRRHPGGRHGPAGHEHDACARPSGGSRTRGSKIGDGRTGSTPTTSRGPGHRPGPGPGETGRRAAPRST